MGESRAQRPPGLTGWRSLYWVAQTSNGRGVATTAVAAVVRTAFDELGLHRLQADTLLQNVASRRVLAHNGFTPIGVLLCAQAKANSGGRTATTAAAHKPKAGR